MNLKWFGIAALLGLAYFWLTERDSQAAPDGPRTLTASWYGEECRGKATASGELFDPDGMTCASWRYYGKRLRVSHKTKFVIVRANDRGPSPKLFSTRTLDLSRAAFAALAPLDKGLLEVTVEVLP